METLEQEIEINEENFSSYFKDVRNSVPGKGEFIEGNEKRQIISLLTATENKMEATAQVMRKLLHASELDAYRIPRMMAEDILSGMSVDEVAQKPYKYTLEMFFYTKPENVPKSDPHWSTISVLNLDEFLDKKDGKIESKILSKEESDRLNLEFREVGNANSESGQDASIGDAASVQASEAE